MLKNPWCAHTNNNSTNINNNNQINDINTIDIGFEDNFEPTIQETLPDSKAYLESLEQKLRKIKKDPNLIKQLQAKREACIEQLLSSTSTTDNNFTDYTFDSSSIDSDQNSVADELKRYIKPEQPINNIETIHLLKHDQLQKQRESIIEIEIEETQQLPSGGDGDSEETTSR